MNFFEALKFMFVVLIFSDHWQSLCVYSSVDLIVCLSISICIFISLYLYIYTSIYLSIFLSFCLSIFLYFYLSIFLYFYLSIFLSFYLSTYLSIYLSIYLVKIQLYIQYSWYQWCTTHVHNASCRALGSSDWYNCPESKRSWVNIQSHRVQVELIFTW